MYLGGLWLIPHSTDPLTYGGPSFAAYDETAGDVTVEYMGGIMLRLLKRGYSSVGSVIKSLFFFPLFFLPYRFGFLNRDTSATITIPTFRVVTMYFTRTVTRRTRFHKNCSLFSLVCTPSALVWAGFWCDRESCTPFFLDFSRIRPDQLRSYPSVLPVYLA